jgi:hypothetical protein
MADEQIESLGINLTIDGGETFTTGLTEAGAALDLFDESAQKIIKDSVDLSTALAQIAIGIKGLSANNSGDIKAQGAAITETLAAVQAAQAKTQASVATAISTAGMTATASGFDQEVKAIESIGEASKVTEAEVKKSTDVIDQAMAGVATATQENTSKAVAAIRDLATEMGNMSTQAASSFKTAFEVVEAQQARTLERNQISRRGTVAAGIMPEADRIANSGMLDARVVEEWEKFDNIIAKVEADVAPLRDQLANLTEGTKEYRAVQASIAEVQKGGVNDLRMLAVEAGTYTDRIREQTKEITALNKANLGAKSELNPTRDGVIDSGSQALINSIKDRNQKTLAAISELVEKSGGGLAAVLQKQVEAEEAASLAETGIYAAIDKTVGTSVDYRKSKLRELLQETTTISAQIVAETRKEVAAKEAQQKFDEAYASTELRLQQAQASRARTLTDAKLSYTPNKAVAGKLDNTAAQELEALAQVRERALVLGPQDHGLLNELKEIAQQAKQTTQALRDETTKAAEAGDPQSIALAARYRKRTQVEGLTAGQVFTGKVQIATESDNAVVRTLARTFQDVQDAIAMAKISLQGFGDFLRIIGGVIQTILSPFQALIGVIQSLGQGLASLVRFASFGFLGGNKAGIDEESASLAKFDTEVKDVSVSAEKSSKSLLDYLNIFNRFKGTSSTAAAPAMAQVHVEAPPPIKVDTTSATSSIGSMLTSVKEAVAGFFGLGESATKAGADVAAGSAHAAEASTNIKAIGTAATETESKLQSFITQFKGGLVEGIGKGIAETIFMSITMGVQNAIFGIGDMIKGAFSSAFAVMDQMVSLEGILQKDIMHEKNYSNLGQAADEAAVKAKELYSWVERLAIVSPFSKDQLVGLLQAANDFGFTAKSSQVLTQAVTDFATVSHRGIQGAQSIINVLGGVRESGMLTSRVVKQLGQAGLDVMPILEKAFHMSPAQIVDNLKRVQLDAKTGVEAIVKTLQTDYGGQAAKAGGTVPGLMSSIIDLKDKMLAISLEPLLDSIVKPILLFIATAGQTKEVEDVFVNLGNAIKNFATNVERFLAGAFYLVSAAIDAIPAPIKEFISAFSEVKNTVFAASIALMVIPPILTMIAGALALIDIPLLLIETAITVLYVAWQKNLFGMRDATNTVAEAVVAAWNYMISDGFEVVISYLESWYESFVGIIQTVSSTITEAFSPAGYNEIITNIGAFASQFEQYFVDLGPQIGTAIEGIYEYLSGIPEFISGVVQDTLDVIAVLPQGFADVMNQVMDYGASIIKFFAQGIASAGQFVIKALNQIGSIITEWLQPHSPPKLLPDLDKWGKKAADVYFKGWTKGDMSMFTDLSGMLEKAVGAIRPDGLSAAGTKRIRQTLADSLQGVKLTGQLDEKPLRDVGGRFNEEIISLTHAYLDASKSADVLAAAQAELETNTKKYDTVLEPLNNRLKQIKETQDSFDISGQMRDLQNVLSNAFATDDQREQAKAKLDELGIQKEINQAEADKAGSTAAIQERINKTQQANDAAKETLELLKERFNAEIEMLGLENQKGKGDSSDAEKKGRKPPKPKKPKEMPNVNTEQPSLDNLELPELDTSGMSSLSDIMADAKKKMGGAFSGVKDALKPALDALGDLKKAAQGAVDAFTTGFSGGDGSALSGLQGFAFSAGTAAAAIVLSINAMIASASNFATTFIAAFELKQGSVTEKIKAGLDATGTTQAVTDFIAAVKAPLLAPVAFASDFVDAFTIAPGTILQKFQAALDSTGVTKAIANFRQTITDALSGLFSGGQETGGKGEEQTTQPLGDSIASGLNSYDFTGKLDAMKENVKKAIDALFGAGTADAAGGLVAEVKTQLDLLFGDVKFDDLTTSLANLVTAVKGAIKDVPWGEWTTTFDPFVTVVKGKLTDIDWKKPLEGIFTGLVTAVTGAIKAAFSFGAGDKKGTEEGLDQAGKGGKQALGGLVMGATDIVAQLKDLIDPGVILAALGLVLGKALNLAFSSVEAIVSAIADTRSSSDKQEMTLGQQIGHTIGQAIVGLLAGVLAFLVTVDYIGLIKSTFTILGDLNKVVSDVLLGLIQGILDEVLNLIGIAKPSWKTSTDAIKKDIDDAMDAMSKAVHGVIDTIGSGFKAVIDYFKKMINSLNPFATDDTTKPAQGPQKDGQPVGGGIDKSKMPALGGGGGGGGGSGLFGNLTGGAEDAGKTAGTSFLGGWTTTVEGKITPETILKDTLDAEKAKATGQTIGANVGAGFNTGVTDGVTGEGAFGWVQVFQDKSKEAWGIHSPSTVAQDNLGMPIGEGVVAGVSAAITAGGDLLAALKTSFTTGYAVVRIATTAFSTAIQQAWVDLKVSLGKTASDLAAALKKTFTDMHTAILKSTADFAKLLTKAWLDLQKAIVKIAQQIRDDVVAAFEDMKDRSLSAFDSLKDDAIKAFEDMKAGILNVLKDMADAIVTALDDVKSKITDAFDKIAGLFDTGGSIDNKMIAAGQKAGKSIVAGIASGLDDPNANSALSTALANLVSRVVKETIKDINENNTGGTGNGTTGGGSTPPPPGDVQDSSVKTEDAVASSVANSLNKLNQAIAQQTGDIKAASFAAGTSNVLSPTPVNKTYVMNMNVTPSQVADVMTNYAIFESLA